MTIAVLATPFKSKPNISWIRKRKTQSHAGFAAFPWWRKNGAGLKDCAKKPLGLQQQLQEMKATTSETRNTHANSGRLKGIPKQILSDLRPNISKQSSATESWPRGKRKKETRSATIKLIWRSEQHQITKANNAKNAMFHEVRIPMKAPYWFVMFTSHHLYHLFPPRSPVPLSGSRISCGAEMIYTVEDERLEPKRFTQIEIRKIIWTKPSFSGSIQHL